MSLKLSPLYSYRSRGGTYWVLLIKGDYSTTKVVPRAWSGDKYTILAEASKHLSPVTWLGTEMTCVGTRGPFLRDIFSFYKLSMNFWGQYERVLSLRLSLITSLGYIFRMIIERKDIERTRGASNDFRASVPTHFRFSYHYWSFTLFQQIWISMDLLLYFNWMMNMVHLK